jgi:hypothetical protein
MARFAVGLSLVLSDASQEIRHLHPFDLSAQSVHQLSNTTTDNASLGMLKENTP